jgi:hypothetical protein
MNRFEANRTAPIGLDVGTSRIVTARQSNDEIRYATQLNAFVGIPYSKLTENSLRKEGVPYSVEGAEILVHGNESERFADLLKRDVRRTMARGVLNPDEPDNVKLIREITATLTGKVEQGQKLCFTVPAAPVGAEDSLTYHEVTIRRVLTDLGFDATSINEGLAVVYAEMENTNYTGIGISFGGGLCNVCLSYLAVPVLSFSVPKAGDFIDASTASVTGEKANRIRLMKEQSFFMNGHFESKLQEVLSVYYDDMIEAVVTNLRSSLESARNLPKLMRPIPLVLSGGTAAPRGFRERFEKVLRRSDFPVALSEVRMAVDPLTTTAKGALVAALSGC